MVTPLLEGTEPAPIAMAEGLTGFGVTLLGVGVAATGERFGAVLRPGGRLRRGELGLAAGVAAVVVVLAVIAVVAIRRSDGPDKLRPIADGPGWARLVADPHLGAPGNPRPAPDPVTAGGITVEVQFFGVEHGRASLALWEGDEKPTSGTYATGDSVPVTDGTLRIAAVHDDPATVDVHLVPNAH